MQAPELEQTEVEEDLHFSLQDLEKLKLFISKTGVLTEKQAKDKLIQLYIQILFLRRQLGDKK